MSEKDSIVLTFLSLWFLILFVYYQLGVKLDAIYRHLGLDKRRARGWINEGSPSCCATCTPTPCERRCTCHAKEKP